MRFKNIITTIAIVSLLVSNANAVNFRKIVLEDMSIGSGTYTSPSGRVTGKTKINAGSFPFKTAGFTSFSPNDLVDGGFDLTIKPGTIISGGPEVSILKYDADGSGAISNAELATAISTIGAVQTTLVIDAGVTVSAAHTFPATLAMRFVRPGKFTKSGGGAIVINGSIDSPHYQIFSGFSVNDINFGIEIGTAIPEWWGIDGTADEIQINSAVSALSGDKGVVLLGHQTYSTAAVITLTTGITLRGINSTVSKIVPASTMTSIIATATSATDVTVEDLWVYGTGTTNTIEAGVFGDSPTRLIIRNCRFGNMTYGVNIETGTRCDVINNHFDGIVGALGVSEGYGTIIHTDSIGCKVLGNTYKTISRHAIYFSAGTSYSIAQGNSIDTVGEGAITNFATAAQNACIGNQFIGNNIKNVTSNASDGHGIDVTQYCLDTTINDNIFDTIENYGIFLNGPQAGADTSKKIIRGVIKGNIVKNADIGIRIINAEDYICKGNVVFNSTTHGIQVGTAGSAAVSRVERIQVEGNIIRTAGTDGIAISSNTGLGSDINLGWNDISDITGTDISLALGIIGFRNTMNPIWIEDVITFSDFDAASTTPTHNFTITLPAGCIVDGVWWTVDTLFAGGSVSAATLEFGVSGGDVDGFFPAENVFTGAGTGFKDSGTTSRGELLYHGTTRALQYFTTATTTFLATLRLTGDNGEDLTAGQVRIWLSYHQVILPTT